MSANKTVTCFRSPSMNLRDARIFSAKYFGTTDFPDDVSAGFSTVGTPNRCPHFLQNFALGRFDSPQ